MKVRVELTFEVDANQWRETYGLDGWEFRHDFRTWVASHFFRFDEPDDDHPVSLASWGPR